MKEWKERFTVDQVVKGRILRFVPLLSRRLPTLILNTVSVDVAARKVEMTFRSKDASRQSTVGLRDLREGQKISGSVKKVEDYGLFINIDNSRLSGLCHKSEVRQSIHTLS